MSWYKSRRGDAMASVIMLMIAIASFAVYVSYHSDSSSKYRQSISQSLAAEAILGRIQAIETSFESWIPILGENSARYKSCFVDLKFSTCTQGLTVGSSDNEIKANLKNSSYATVPTWDLAGLPLGGTESAPVLYDGNGQLCPSGSQGCAMFQVVSYMIWSGLSTNPDYIQFYFKISAIKSQAGKLASGSEFGAVNLGSTWKSAPPATKCTGTDVATRFTSDGKLVCESSKLMVSCPTGTYMGGFDSSGNLICNKF